MVRVHFVVDTVRGPSLQREMLRPPLKTRMRRVFDRMEFIGSWGGGGSIAEAARV